MSENPSPVTVPDSSGELSWGGSTVITEPAPRLAYPARYLAPLARRVNEGDMMLAAIGVPLGGLGGLLVIGFGPMVVQALFGADEGVVRAVLVVGLIGAVAGSYLLVARHGLRFLPHQEATHAAVANVAWRNLPRDRRKSEKEQLRVANTAARILCSDPSNTAAVATLREQAHYLDALARRNLTSQEASSKSEA